MIIQWKCTLKWLPKKSLIFGARRVIGLEVYLRPITRRAPKISDFLGSHLMYISIVWSQSSFGQHLLCIFNNYITMCPGRIIRKLYIWLMFTWVKRTFDTGNPNRVTWLLVRFMHFRTSVYFLAHFTLSDERTCVTRQENSIGADGESSSRHNPAIFGEMTRIVHNTLFMHFVLFKQHVYILLMAIVSYPCGTCWDNGNYSYPNCQGLLSQRPLCGRPAVAEIELRGVSIGRTKNM